MHALKKYNINLLAAKPLEDSSVVGWEKSTLKFFKSLSKDRKLNIILFR